MESHRSTPLLSVRGLRAGYQAKTVVFAIDLHVDEGEILAIIGHNGAGKTTALKAIFGFLKPSGGHINYGGQEITGSSPAQNVQRGMSFTPAEHCVFGELSVTANLSLGARGDSAAERQDEILDLFPILRERRRQIAGTLSGGEQRMLGIGIALMSRPRLMLLDEPSIGLSPAMVRAIMAVLKERAEQERVSIVLLEQNVNQALSIANRANIMRAGRIILDEDAESMLARGQWWDLF